VSNPSDYTMWLVVEQDNSVSAKRETIPVAYFALNNLCVA